MAARGKALPRVLEEVARGQQRPKENQLPAIHDLLPLQDPGQMALQVVALLVSSSYELVGAMVVQAQAVSHGLGLGRGGGN